MAERVCLHGAGRHLALTPPRLQPQTPITTKFGDAGRRYEGFDDIDPSQDNNFCTLSSSPSPGGLKILHLCHGVFVLRRRRRRSWAGLGLMAVFLVVLLGSESVLSVSAWNISRSLCILLFSLETDSQQRGRYAGGLFWLPSVQRLRLPRNSAHQVPG